MKQLGFFDLLEHLKRLSESGDPLEEALAYSDGAKGGRPPYDPVAMFKVLILAAQNTVGDARMEFLSRDRLSWLRFLGFDLGKPTPDESTIRQFRERLIRAGAIRRVFEDFDRQLRRAGYLAMGGQDDRRDLARQSGQGGAEGYRRPLDGEGRPAARQGGRAQRSRTGDPGVRVEATHRHRPPLRLHPQPCRHRRHPSIAATARDAPPPHTDNAGEPPPLRSGRCRPSAKKRHRGLSIADLICVC